MMKKILFVVSSTSIIGPKKRRTGNLLPEVAHPYEVFKKEGYEIDVYSVKGGDAPIEMVEPEESINQAFLKGEGPAKFKNSGKIEDVSIDKYDAVFVPGGLAPVADLPDNPTVQKILSSMYEKGKVVSAVCHGPVCLINVKLTDGSYLVSGKKVTGFSITEEFDYAREDVPFELENELKDRGADYSCITPWQAYSITDGRLVTGQNPASATGVAQRVVTILEA
ncbi:MAG: type 1 glutamine amidotransferase domain-containing protein [Bacteroidetes bacterium]|nr:type 1 glutamine amidotransferase domain-containing protein [Bacteroidota bacterium]